MLSWDAIMALCKSDIGLICTRAHRLRGRAEMQQRQLLQEGCLPPSPKTHEHGTDTLLFACCTKNREMKNLVTHLPEVEACLLHVAQLLLACIQFLQLLDQRIWHPATSYHCETRKRPSHVQHRATRLLKALCPGEVWRSSRS